MSKQVLIWIHDISTGERVNAVVASDLEMDERLFQSYTITFSIPATSQKVIHLAQDVLLIVNGERFFITKIEKIRDGSEADIKVTAEVTWMKLTDWSRPGSFIIDNMTVREGLTAILAGTGWGVQEVTPDSQLRSFEATDASVLDILWQWAKVCGCEMDFDNRNSGISMLSEVGVDLGLGFRYGRNLTQITRTEITPKVTRLYCYGRNELSIERMTGGKPYIENFDYFTGLGETEAFARRWHLRESVYRDDSFLGDGPLHAAGVVRLQTLSHPQVSYKLSVIDLSELSGLDESVYRIGDTVHIADDLLDIDIQGRVSRTVRHPANSSEDLIEIATGEILLPDPSVSNSRENTTQTWELFESRNWFGQRQIRTFSTILNRIGLRTIAEAEWIVGYKISGTGAGTGTITLTPVDDETGEVLWPAKTFAVAAGVAFNWDFTFGKKAVPAGRHIMVIRATASAGGLNIAPYETALWVHAIGTTRENVVLTNSVRFDFPPSGNGAVQTWQVPDDVFEAMMEVHGGGNGRVGGGKLVAKFPVLGGQIYDVYVGGGSTTGVAGKWPNGGQGVSTYASPYGMGGAGSSDVRPTGSLPTDTLIIAGAAGGTSESGPNHPGLTGGIGGFYGGGNGDGYRAGGGASQMAGGQPVTAGQGAPGSFWQGGSAGEWASAFDFPGGGGGGGWYGGASAGAGDASGGGGGGSGWVRADAIDLEIEDGENLGHGYVIISWETPPEVT